MDGVLIWREASRQQALRRTNRVRFRVHRASPRGITNSVPLPGTITAEQSPEPCLSRQLVAVSAGLEPQNVIPEQLAQRRRTIACAGCAGARARSNVFTRNSSA